MKEDERIDLFACKYNKIDEIPEIKKIDYNIIKEISINHSSIKNLFGIEKFSQIIMLNLSSNQLTLMSSNNTVNLKYLKILNLSCNYLTNTNGIENLISLEEADFSHNKIKNISSFALLSNKSNLCLVSLKLEDNLLEDLECLEALER